MGTRHFVTPLTSSDVAKDESKSVWVNVRHLDIAPGGSGGENAALTIIQPPELEAGSAFLIFEGLYGAATPAFATAGYLIKDKAGPISVPLMADSTPYPGCALVPDLTALLCFDWIRWEIVAADGSTAVVQTTAARTFQVAAREV